MHLIRNYVLFLLLSVAINPAYSQLKESFAAGTIELADGQKINGFIKENELGKLAYKINFKLLQTDKAIKVYDTAQLRSFSINGDVFELFHLSVNNLADSISMFAKLILIGKASLYKTFYNSEDLFIIKTDTNNYVLQNDKREDGLLATEMISFNFENNINKAISGSSATERQIENIKFNQDDFIKIISEYNRSSGSENKLMNTKPNKIHFLLANAGGMYKNSNENEFCFQIIYRTYLPKISRSTSINVGLNYFKYKNTETINDVFFVTPENYTSTLVSLPLYLQQNILNKNIRPYLFAGLNISYFKVVNEQGISQIQKGFQNNFGFGFLFGGGIELDIYKGLMIKSEYRYEVFTHLVLVGFGYHLRRN